MDTPPVKRLREDNHIDLNGSVVLPSQVIYIKDLKKNVTEADFHDALSSFGPISYVMCMRDSGKALVEFENFNSAYQCIEQAKIAPIKIAGSPAVLQFSKSNVIRRSGLESHQPSNVLVIIVYNVLYPITLDVIYQICSTHGKVLRIALMKGKENMEVQALVEFDLAETAKRVKYAINGADIYAGCCTLKVEFSVLNRVKVIQNSHDQWDYTICDENANVEDIKSEILATSFNHPPPNHQKSLSPHQRVVSTPPANSCASSTTNAVASTLPPINIVPQPVYYMSVPIYPSPVQSQYLAQSHSTHAANNGNVVVLQPRKRPLDKDVFSPLSNFLKIII